MKCIKCGKEIEQGSLFCRYCGKKQQRQQSYRKPKRRGNGQGTVFKRGRTYTAVKTRYVNGKRITQQKGGFAKAADAVKWLSAEQKKKDTLITLKELYDKWLPTHRASQSTMYCYQAGFKVFAPVWYTSMQEQDIDDLQECISECESGKRTRQNAKIVLNLIYKFGIPRGYIPENLNLAEFVKAGGGEQGTREGLNAEELEKVRAAINTVPFADFIYCQCYLGFRPSELLQLRRADYDAEKHTLKGGIKTEAGKNRTVTIAPKIEPIITKLMPQKAEQYIFGKEGERISIKKYRAGFYEALDKIGVQPIQEGGAHRLTPHSCRHTFATMLKRIDAPDKDKLALIGHTETSMLRSYQDTPTEDLRAITDRL